MKWTEEQDNFLLVSIQQNYPYSVIANFISQKYNLSLTRGAISGRWSRLIKKNPDLKLQQKRSPGRPIHPGQCSETADSMHPALRQDLTPSSPARCSQVDASKSAPLLPQAVLAPSPSSGIKEENFDPVGILALTNHSCRWMLSDKVYCGQPAIDLRHPYCQKHANLAYIGKW